MADRPVGLGEYKGNPTSLSTATLAQGAELPVAEATAVRQGTHATDPGKLLQSGQLGTEQRSGRVKPEWPEARG